MLKKAMFITVLIIVIGYMALAAKAPREFVLQTPVLDEASGLDYSVLNSGILWSHNDSGGKAEVYALDSEGRLVATLQLKGISNRDWEEICVAKDPLAGKSYIYIGEIGDNAAKYESIKIYRVEEPVINPQDTLIVTDKIDTIKIQYDDGARDAEAFFVHPQTSDIYIINKREEQVGLYRVAQPVSLTNVNIAKRLQTLPLGWVTAADISANGKQILVKTYPGVWRMKAKLNKSGEMVLKSRLKSLPYKLEPQGEGLCYDAKSKGYYTLSEAAADQPQVLYYYK